VPYAGHDFGAVGLDLHAPAASVALLAAPKFAIYGFQGYRYSRGESGQGRHQALAVRLSSGLKSKHSEEFLS
jgi:hypothetical protein